MADLAFYAAQTDGAGFGVRAENFIQGVKLHGVTHAGAGAVRFHQADIARGIFHLFKSLLYGDFLAFGVGSGNAFALAVRRRAHGADDGIDFVAVFDGVGEAF